VVKSPDVVLISGQIMAGKTHWVSGCNVNEALNEASVEVLNEASNTYGGHDLASKQEDEVTYTDSETFDSVPKATVSVSVTSMLRKSRCAVTLHPLIAHGTVVDESTRRLAKGFCPGSIFIFILKYL